MFDKLRVASAFLFLMGVLVGTAVFGSTHDGRQPLGKISGRVIDQETSAPLENVNVMIAGTTRGAASSHSGNFIIDRINEGTYTLMVSRVGYKVETIKNVRVSAAKTTFKEIQLVPDSIQMDELIVTAARREQTANMTPASVSVVNSTEMQARNVFTFHQALENTPGISLQRSIDASVQSLSIRGSSDVAGGGVGNRVLLAVDGRPALRADTGGALWSLVPTAFVDRVEIVKGAFSSLYGSTAMGGVINIITKKPRSQSTLNVEANGGFYEVPPLSIRYKDSPNFFNGVTLSHSRRLGGVSYLLSASRKESDGHRQRSAYELYNLYGKFMFELAGSRELEVTLGGDIGRNDYPHPWLGNLNPLEVHPRRVDNFQKRRSFNGDVFYQDWVNPRLRYSSRLYYHRTYFRSEFNPDDPERRIPGNEPFGQFTESTSQKLGNIWLANYELDDRNFLVTGLDIQRDLVDSIPDTIMFGKHQTTNIGLFAQDEHRVGESLTLTLGLRFDLHKLDGGRTLAQLSPKGALLFRLADSWSLRFLVGRAFRAPSIAERFFQEEIAGGTRFKPNPELNAESVVSYEVGGRISPLNWLHFDVSYFRYDYDDMIFWINIGREQGLRTSLFQVRNLNQARMQGLDLSVNFSPWRFWHTSFNYTYLDAKDLSENRTNDTLPYKVEHTIGFSTSLSYGLLNLNLDGRHNSEVKEVFLYPNDEPEAFLVINGKVAVDIGKSVQFSVGAKNIFNVQYEELARYRMPGRTWIFGANYSL